MRHRQTAVLIVTALTLVSCDEVHFAHIDVGSRSSTRVTAVELTPPERDRAEAIIRSTAGELGLRCEPTEYSIIRDSYDPSIYRLFTCRADEQSNDIQLAVADDHLTVEIHDISGKAEPDFFRKCRIRITEALQAGLPNGSVRVCYPCGWGSSADHRHTEEQAARRSP